MALEDGNNVAAGKVDGHIETVEHTDGEVRPQEDRESGPTPKITKYTELC